MTRFETVRQATVDAIKQAAFEAYQTIEKEALVGFGICTDDDVDSVYHVYATREWVSEREPDYAEIGLISVEWTQASEDTLFLSLSKLFREWASSDENAPRPDYDVDRTKRFRALVEAMKECRSEGLFDARTLLSVSSTDPDGLMIKLACDAGRHLNTEEVAASYCKMMDC
ncbi:MAG: hypothetical protein JWN66_5025 [Sphingomonas bacterium]|uniref:DUF4303 domain-containing protein n=1 Tax=Sphingomonas bacterium TaxID=1895847 RepID=UPI002639EC45|nr:DUF4303 domain-containing protein [Sphingomonas bacterium]MDB5707909.1 hypothetical protein [Sphingomonas bacterium]